MYIQEFWAVTLLGKLWQTFSMRFQGYLFEYPYFHSEGDIQGVKKKTTESINSINTISVRLLSVKLKVVEGA